MGTLGLESIKQSHEIISEIAELERLWRIIAGTVPARIPRHCAETLAKVVELSFPIGTIPTNTVEKHHERAAALFVISNRYRTAGTLGYTHIHSFPSVEVNVAKDYQPVGSGMSTAIRTPGKSSVVVNADWFVYQYANTMSDVTQPMPLLLQEIAALRKARDELEARLQERTAELVQINAALRESEERYRELFDNTNAETANRAKGELLATMTHELRTPLNVVTGYIDLLLEKEFGPLTNKQIEILQRIYKNARGLFDLISDVLDLNRLEAGRLPVERQEVQVAQLFREIETETQGLRDLSELTFVWNIESGVPVLSTDPGKVKVVIKNLLNNAIKFTKAGSVTVEARQVNRGVEISVTDTGVGIPVEQQTLIFEAFRQGNALPVRGHKGVGLGLHIAKQLLDMLNGTIHVESEVGHGTAFRVWLPTNEWRGR
jgi:signal transduction histidine kinase